MGTAINPKAVAYYISPETDKILSRSRLQPGDLLITIAGTLGRVGYVPMNAPPLNCNQAVAFVRLDPQMIDLFYAGFACQAQIADLLTLRKIGTIGNLNLEQIRQFKIPFPPLREQQRIAERLEQADRLRRTRRYALELTDTFLPAAFLELFGDQNPAASSWPTAPLGDHIEAIEGGVNFNPVGENDPASDWRVLKVSAVSWSDFLAEESKPISPTESFSEKLIVQRGDLIMSRANTVELVGAVARVRTPPPKVLLPDKLWRLKLRTKSLLPDYLLYALRGRVVRREIEIRASGTSGSMKNISKEDVRDLRLPVPPLPLQQKFAALVERVERLRAVQREALRQAEHLFASLLHRAFSG
jgi:type I restriction enzyme S subunit